MESQHNIEKKESEQLFLDINYNLQSLHLNVEISHDELEQEPEGVRDKEEDEDFLCKRKYKNILGQVESYDLIGNLYVNHVYMERRGSKFRRASKTIASPNINKEADPEGEVAINPDLYTTLKADIQISDN